MMEQYYVEGLYVNRQGRKKQTIEPFARSFWANSAEDALRLASESLEGGQWVKGPTIGEMSEEQRMRAMGAPELPGFGAAPKRK